MKIIDLKKKIALYNINQNIIKKDSNFDLVFSNGNNYIRTRLSFRYELTYDNILVTNIFNDIVLQETDFLFNFTRRIYDLFSFMEIFLLVKSIVGSGRFWTVLKIMKFNKKQNRIDFGKIANNRKKKVIYFFLNQLTDIFNFYAENILINKIKNI